MIVSGINVNLLSDQMVTGVYGGSIEVIPNQFSPNNSGFSTDNLVDLVVSSVDLMGNAITGVTFEITGSINSNSTNTGDFIAVSVGQNDNLDITASVVGYQENTISVSFVEGTPQRLVIVLTEVDKIDFNCTTTFKNSEGVTVSKPISSGYVEVTFMGNNPISTDGYSVLFEAIPSGGSKYNSVVLGYSLLSSTSDSITYKVDVVNQIGDFCYLSNIIKKQC